MNLVNIIQETIASLNSRTDLCLLDSNLKIGNDPIPNETGIDESIADLYSKIESFSLKWMLDLNETAVNTIDTGLDIVAGTCRIPALNDLLNQSKSATIFTSPFFEINNNLNSDYLVFDNGSPDFISLLKRTDNTIKDHVYLAHSSYPEKIFDLNIRVVNYLELGAQAGFMSDWQLALLKIKKHTTENLLHYLPEVFPEYKNSTFFNQILMQGLTE